jgi:hypothetical protein
MKLESEGTNMAENEEIVARSIEKYNSAADKHGISSRSVLWDDQQSQYLRFHELVRYLDLNDSSRTLLDVGCGNGELFKFLNFLGYRGRYRALYRL